MNKALLEKNLVVILFILVLVVFSFAQEDSKKLDRVYKSTTLTLEPQEVNSLAMFPELSGGK